MRKSEVSMETLNYESDYLFIFHHNFNSISCSSHWHNAVEIIMPIENTLTMGVNMEVYQLNESDILIIPSGDLHELHTEQTGGQRIILRFDLQVLNTIRGFIDAAYVYTKRRLITAGNAPELHSLIKKLLLDMLDENLRREMYYEISIINKILDISVHLFRWQYTDGAVAHENLIRRREHASKLNECIGYINMHYKDNLSLDMAAYAAGFSKFHFARWFRQYAGISFYDYLIKVRIEKAEALLLGSDKPVTEIAFESGFQSIVTFNRIFKEHKKCTPTEYRSFNYIHAGRTNNGLNQIDKEDNTMEKDHIITMKASPHIPSRLLAGPLPGAVRLNADSTFNNPFLWADVPDPDVIRVDGTYYMVSTTMYFTPHCPIMKSHDLVNWEIINYACDILDDSDACTLRNGAHAYGKGTWAASIRYHNGTFYVTVTSFTTEKTYIFQTEDIENGPWRRYTIDHVYHDQSLLFDDDGRVYLASGAGSIHILELTADASAVKQGGFDRVVIENADVGGKGGLPAEGSHFYKIHGKYYLFLIAWPPSGSGRRIELCYLADCIEGPYEGRVILDDDLGFKNMGVAQGGIIDMPDGSWYAMLFQDHGAVGRIPVLIPMVWQDGWPVLGVDGFVPQQVKLPISGAEVKRIVSSDEFYQHDVSKNYTAVNDIHYLYGHIDENAISGGDRQDEELLVNGRFADGAACWENADVAKLSVVTDESLGKPVLWVSGRATTGSGPKQDITGKLVPGGVYEVYARVKYVTGPPAKDFLISVFRGERWQNIQNMGSGTLIRNKWGVIKGTYTLPVDSQLTGVAVFIETPWVARAKKDDDLMDFYVERVSMIAKPMLWNTETAAYENDPNGSRLQLVWQWNHNPDNNLWSLAERPGYLRLKTGYLCHELTGARNTLTQRTFGPVCAGMAALDAIGMKDGDVAGLAALQDMYGYVGVKMTNGVKYVIMVNASSGYPEEIESIPLTGERVYLRIDFDFTDAIDQARFFYSEDEIHWRVIGDTLSMRYKLTHFTGYRFALFYYATQITGGHVDFDYFRISDQLMQHDDALAVLAASFGGDITVSGVHNTFFALPIHMDALPDGPYKGIYMSFPIPEILDVEDVVFCHDNIIGDTAYDFTDRRLSLSVTGEAVSFSHKASDTFALLRFKVKGFVTEDTILTLSSDYIYADGGEAVYRTHDMRVNICLTALETNAKAKIPGYANPLISHKYGADPWALEYKGRLYLYLTADTYEYNDYGRLINNTYGKINKITVISSSDLLNWTDHGEIPVAGLAGAAKWAKHSWAPAVACKKIGGKDQFFLYFANDASNIGVLTADSPVGPWTDPLGAPLIHRGIPGVEGVTWCFDPAVLVDDDGCGYLYFGGGLPSLAQKDVLHPCTARVIKLGSDMISTSGEAVMIDAPAFFEDSGINKINGKYYYSYCSNFEGERPKSYPAHGVIAYMVGDHPMGPFTYEGTIFKNPDYFFVVGGNNHHCLFMFKGRWYIAYHAQTLGKSLGRVKGYRSPHINALALSRDGRIHPVEANMEGVTLPVTLDPYKQTGAETAAWCAGVTTAAISGCTNLCATDIHDGDWLAVANADFGTTGAARFTTRLASCVGGEIEIRLDSPLAEIVGTLGTGATGGEDIWDIRSCDVKLITGVHHVFFVFKGDSDRNLMNFDYWFFEKEFNH